MGMNKADPPSKRTHLDVLVDRSSSFIFCLQLSMCMCMCRGCLGLVVLHLLPAAQYVHVHVSYIVGRGAYSRPA
jgi:hypothetical protein